MHRAKLAAATFLIGLAASGSLVAAAPAAEAAASGCVAHNYDKGDVHECVRKIQKIANGISVGAKLIGASKGSCGTLSSSTIDADAVFGSVTVAKVKDFQGSSCLTADGKVGPKTWTQLCYQIGVVRMRLIEKGASNATVNTGFKAVQEAGCGSITAVWY